MSNVKNKIKINIFDILVIVILLALILGTIYIYLFFQLGFTDNSSEISYTLNAEKVRDIFKGNINEGDVVYDGLTGNEIGTVKNIYYSDYFEYDDNTDGSGMYIKLPGYINIEIIISSLGIKSSDDEEAGCSNIKIGNITYRSGAEKEFHTGNYYFKAVVSDTVREEQ